MSQAGNQPDGKVEEQHILDLDGDAELQLDAAIAYVQQHPNNGRAYVIRAMVYAKLEQRSEQIADLDTAVRLLSTDPNQRRLLLESICARGLAYQSDGDDLSAIANFGEVLELDSMYASALQSRAFSYLRLGKLDDARTDIDRAIAITPDDPIAFDVRSRIREAMNDHDGAESDLKEYQRLIDR